MNNKLTLGSLFDGSGGFPLAGIMAGITPVWASEIEPFCIRVTTKRIPQMKHYGDISKINGSEIEPVDIITFGSPCQNLSLAGNRSGLNGEKSSMFFEAIRVIKEMRNATNGKYPRWIVWENVPGALSSSKGADFRTVLDEICKIKDETVSVPMPEKKWETAGEIMGEDYSIAYRILNAQFFGVPQRRRRIFLVTDFGGQTAGKILFESEGVFGNFTKERGSWQGAAADAETSVNKPISFEPGIMARMGGHYFSDKTKTLRSHMGDNQMCVAIENHPNDSRVKIDNSGTIQTLTGRAGTGGGNVPMVMNEREHAVNAAAGFCTEHSAKSRSIGYEEGKAPTLRAGVVPAAMAIEKQPNIPIVMNEREHAATILENMANPLMATDYKGTQCVFEDRTQNIEPKTLKMRSGCEGGGKGALLQSNKSATLSCNNDQTVFVPFVKGTRPHSETEGQEWKQDATANTLNTFDVGETRCNELAVKAYGICSDASNSMKSDNPNSGIYEADTARTIDRNGGNPASNQGGIAVVCIDQGGGKSSCNISEELSPTLARTHGGEPAICIQGSVIGRKDENGPNGDGVNEEVSFTLNTVDRHAVCAAEHKEHNQEQPDDDKAQKIASFYPQMKAESQCYRDDGISNTLVNGTNPGYQNGIVEPAYTVRRLTPLECCRLQGFPDYWCDGLETENPTAADIEEWSDVFETFRKALGKSSKPKSERQIIKWLKNPCSDSVIYSMWGNGVSLPVVFFVLAGIAAYWEMS